MGDNGQNQTTVPAALSNVVAIACGEYHNLALKQDGTVLGWGMNSSGQATGTPAKAPYAPGLVTISGQVLSNVVAIAAGDAHSLALRSDGSIVGWGWSSYGQILSLGELGNIKNIWAGGSQSIAQRNTGELVTWTSENSLTIPPTWTNIIRIAAGDYHTRPSQRWDGCRLHYGILLQLRPNQCASGSQPRCGYLRGSSP